MEDSDIQYEKKIVAFLDILGFRNLVFQNRDNAKTVIAGFDDALRHCLDCLSLEGGPDWFSAKLFSDCICLSFREDDLYYMLSELAFLQLYLLGDGIFLKGALDSGHHFENERMILITINNNK